MVLGKILPIVEIPTIQPNKSSKKDMMIFSFYSYKSIKAHLHEL